jgi:hypothetical protein
MMKLTFDKETWTTFIDGYTIMDGTLGRGDGFIGFVQLEVTEKDGNDDNYLVKTRFLQMSLHRPPEKRFYRHMDYAYATNPMISSTCGDNYEFVITDTVGNVGSYTIQRKDGYEGEIPEIPNHNYGGIAIEKIVRIDNTIFVTGGKHRVLRRTGYQSWSMENIPLPKPLQNLPEDYDEHMSKSQRDEVFFTMLRSNLFDMAGFSLSDMYAVGNKGVVWHFNGKTWELIPFPSNLDLHTVCCADDGQVYITTQEGKIFKGRDNRWELLVNYDNLSLPYRDSAWFAGRLWCANDYGMWALEGKKMVPCQSLKNNPVPYECAYTSGRIDISPDKKKMLICGQRGASLFDGEKWEVLFHTGSYD